MEKKMSNAMRKYMTGKLENLSKPEKKIFQYCGNELQSSCKVFLFIMSDLKLVKIAFIDAASYLPPPFYLLWCHSLYVWRRVNVHAAVAFAPFLLILLKSGPTDVETFLPFSGSLWKRFLIFTAEKKVHSFAFRGDSQRSAYPEMKTKGTTTSKKMSSTYHTVCNTRRMKKEKGEGGEEEVRELQDVRPFCQAACRGGGRFSLSHSVSHRCRNIINM